MEIVTGLFEHGVWQRTAEGTSDAAITGTCARDGRIVAFVETASGYLSAFEGTEVGEARGGRFEARIAGLPAGGPYDIQLTLCSASGKWLDTVQVRDVLVGDVWLLAGQSNMQGIGLLAEKGPSHPEVRGFYMDDRWDVAADPLHNLFAAVDEVHRLLGGGVLPAREAMTGVGPGLAFGVAMRDRRGVPQGLIACAHGGTSLTQWDPARRDEGSQSLYGALVRRLRKNGQRVAGMIWYQGESDANAEAAPLFTQRMSALIAALRTDSGDPGLPVAMVQIARVAGWWSENAPYWNSVQDQQWRLPGLVDRLATVPAIDLSLDDSIHVSARDMQVLGRRLAEAMETLSGTPGALPPPIEPGAARVVAAHRDMATIEVTFTHTAGDLQAAGRPWGFQVGEDGVDRVYDVRLAGDRAYLCTNLSPLNAEGQAIYYGRGTNPYCNIMDAAGRSLPVFGPWRVGRTRALTPAVQDFAVSPLLPGAGNLADVPEPAGDGWTARHFAGEFASRREELARVGDEDAAVGYRCRIELAEAMELVTMLGYDGPVKLWIDGVETFHDPHGTNPATPIDALLPVSLAAGVHTITVLLGANRGRAYGIWLRFERLGVTPAQLAAGSVTLPAILA